MSRIKKVIGEQGLQNRITFLEKMINELISEIEIIKKDLQSKNQANDKKNFEVISDVQSFKVGDNLVTEKTGWIVDKGEIICEGDEQYYLEKQLPFSIVSIKKITNI